jgi:hypothetical protein
MPRPWRLALDPVVRKHVMIPLLSSARIDMLRKRVWNMTARVGLMTPCFRSAKSTERWYRMLALGIVVIGLATAVQDPLQIVYERKQAASWNCKRRKRLTVYGIIFGARKPQLANRVRHYNWSGAPLSSMALLCPGSSIPEKRLGCHGSLSFTRSLPRCVTRATYDAANGCIDTSALTHLRPFLRD